MALSASPSSDIQAVRCPVCCTLPLDNLPIGTDAPSLEYCIDLDAPHRESIEVWSAHCHLAKLVCDLSRYWSGENDGRQFLENESPTYIYTCCKHPEWPGGDPESRQYICADYGRGPPDSFNLCTTDFSTPTESFLIHSVEDVVVHADPMSGPSVANMRFWIDSCNEKHDACKTDPTPLPTRVLDVQDLQAIKLHESGGRCDRYIALSHCWGSSRAFLTEHSTLNARKEGFSLEEVPKTFRDAILVTHTLGIRYLWLDSLCIIQDDISDWKVESSRMGDVYANSYLTISAANADDDARGFLGVRRFRYASLKITSSGGQSTQVYLHDYRAHISGGEGSQPLDSRAWTLQEQLLPRRTLRFGMWGMSWECQHGDFAECKRIGDKGLQGGFLDFSWLDITKWYSFRDLTYDKDKLPALAGLASRFGESHFGNYCAGLWWENMPECLLWQRDTGSLLQKPSRYLAPTWSWASLNGCIDYGLIGLEYNRMCSPDSVVFYNVKVQASEESPYGEVQEGGCLKLQAPLMPLTAVLPYADEGLQADFKIAHPEDYGRRVKGNLDLGREDERDVFGLILTCGYWTGYREDPNPSKVELCNCEYMYGLIVCQCGRSPNGYERIGFFQIDELRKGVVSQILDDQPIKEVTLY